MQCMNCIVVELLCGAVNVKQPSGYEYLTLFPSREISCTNNNNTVFPAFCSLLQMNLLRLSSAHVVELWMICVLCAVIYHFLCRHGSV